MTDPTAEDAGWAAVLTAVDGARRDGEREDDGALGASPFQQWCRERDAAMDALTRARMRWGNAGIHR